MNGGETILGIVINSAVLEAVIKFFVPHDLKCRGEGLVVPLFYSWGSMS